MKHRSVIAFVIVAAALFSLPQLSHDLRELKGAVGARLHRELLYAFLDLPAGEPTAAAPAARPAESLLASCPKEKSNFVPAKSGRAEASGRAGARTAEKGFEQSAMIGDPKNDPINEFARAEVSEPSEAKAETEVAMIIPPDAGVDPRALTSALASGDEARIGADKLRVNAEGLRVSYNTRARFEAQGGEWQKTTEEFVRQFNNSMPGTYEFRVLRDGARVKVLKVKCGECPAAGAPRQPRAPRQAPPAAPLPPVAFTSAEWAGE
ncbi:MAG: hypothetical protein JOZ96_08275 [Acidobacteria bacterium]|nr:hypothetical protein [Acidobacteriota bacterium]